MLQDLAKSLHFSPATFYILGFSTLLFLALIVGFLLNILFRRWSKNVQNNLAELILAIAGSLSIPLSILAAVYAALEVLTLPRKYEQIGSKSIFALAVIVTFYFLSKVVILSLSRWSHHEVALERVTQPASFMVRIVFTLLAETVSGYDPMGRPSAFFQCTPYDCASSSPSYRNGHYSYDLAGDMTTEITPWYVIITNTFDGAQHVTQSQSSFVDGAHPAVLGTFAYNPFGALSTLTGGCTGTGCTGAVETYAYNNRLQPVMMQLSSAGVTNCLVLNYYSSGAPNPPTSCATPAQGSGNNGNAMGYYYSDPHLGHSNVFTYDTVNRLTGASATGTSPANYNWTYTFDRFGNMQCSGSTGGVDGCAAMTYNTANNQLTAIGSATPHYDAAGNMTNDGTGTFAHSYTWNAEGRLASAAYNGSTTTYTYNALGQRVSRAGPAVPYSPIYEYYDAFGVMTLLINSQFVVEAPFPAVGGKNYVKYQNNATYFMHTNALGSTGTITDQTGALVDSEIYDPWGQRWGTYNTPYDERFAGMTKERDAESGLDPTPNRMFTSSYGRWLSPDPAGTKAVTLTDPQTWNM